jgi:hypothetical protein
MDALEPLVKVLNKNLRPYRIYNKKENTFDINLEVAIQPENAT